MSQSLTSSAEDLFKYLKDLNNQTKEPEPVELYIPPTESSRSVTGRYKFEVHDDGGLVYDSGDWKPNLILNCGMDKVAEMPWAQVFQWAVAGTDPTPTKESYEETGLKVELLSTSKCPAYEKPACGPYNPPNTLLARATESNRRAPDAIPAGNCVQKTFGESSDVGRLLYLRDIDTQYNVVCSCPVYTVEPEDPDVRLMSTCTGALCTGLFTTGQGGVSITPGNGFVGLLSTDTGLPWNQGGLILERKSFDLPVGSCSAPVLCAYDNTHPLSGGYYVNPVVGIEIPLPNRIDPQFTTVTTKFSMNDANISLIDPGKGLPYTQANCNSSTIPVQFAPPAKDSRKGEWLVSTYRNPSTATGFGPGVIYTLPKGIKGGGVVAVNAGGKGAVVPDLDTGRALDSRNTRWGVSQHCAIGGGYADTNRERRVHYGAFYGGGNFCNLLGVGSHTMSDSPVGSNFGNYRWQTFRDQMLASKCGSFQEFLSKNIITQYFAPPETDLAGNDLLVGSRRNKRATTSHGHYFHKYPQTQGGGIYKHVLAGFGYQAPGTFWPVQEIAYQAAWTWGNDTTSDINHTLPSDGTSTQNFGKANLTPPTWLPYWIKNGLTSMDLTTTSGGKTYLDHCSSWNTFKTNIIDVAGDPWEHPSTATGSPFVEPAFSRTTELGNLFSGLPLEVFKNLPDYTWQWTPEAVDLGGALANGFELKLDNLLAIVADNSNNFSGGTNPFDNNVVFSPTAGNNDNTSTFHEIATNGNTVIATATPVKGTVTEITFHWSRLYECMKQIQDNPPGKNAKFTDVLGDHNLVVHIGLSKEAFNYIPLAAATGELIVDPSTKKATGINIIDIGSGYARGETVATTAILPAQKPASLNVKMTPTGGVSAVEILDGGAGYATDEMLSICFPAPPPAEIVSYNLMIQPVETYETINNGHFHENINLPSPSYKTDIFHTEQTYLGNQYKTHGWYVTGNNPATNATYCGTDFLSAANQVAMTRTYDFYMELQPVTYTELGFKESPASRELFSRIVLDNPIKLCPGQFLRVAYQLIVNWEPGDVPRYKVVPSNEFWYNMQDNSGGYYLSGYECIQGNGMCVVGGDGVAIPYDITGVANEPYAPGSTNLGPQYGYCNRWKNGDTRLSWPTKEYKQDSHNPWILGGDQVNPPDWAAKFWDSPTVNYMPRDFRSYVEWPAIETDVPDVSNDDPVIKWKTIGIPAGPELPIERDAFDHWFTKALPSETNTITFTNFVPNFVNGKGRWDFIVTKGYLADVYPHLLASNTVYHNNIRNQAWIGQHFLGDQLPQGGPAAYSAPGVFPGPVVEYTGTFGSLHDPMSVKGGTLSRNVSHLRNPWAKYDFKFLEPNNTGGSGDAVTITYSYCQGGTMTFTSPDFCWKKQYPLSTNTIAEGVFGLAERQAYYDYGSVQSVTEYPVNPDAGGGITKLDSWAPWSHTPLITSTELAYLTGDDRDQLVPDTVGNWSLVEAIPVAGASAFVSTSDDPFAPVGFYTNRSHTVSGCKTSPTHRPVHRFDGPLSFETPTYVDSYKPTSCTTIKRAVFETNFANLTGIKCVGIGPTSTTLDPIDMTDAARFNTYLFKFGPVDSGANNAGLSKLTTYKLNVTFQNSWYRNLKI